jgi:hypothetical protein
LPLILAFPLAPKMPAIEVGPMCFFNTCIDLV